MYRKIKPHFNRRNLANLLVLVIIGYLVFATGRVIAKNFALQQEVDRLHREIELLHIRNQELGYELAYYQTDSFADKEARDKLGLMAPGEKLVIFPDRVPRGSGLDMAEDTRPAVEQVFDNLAEWMYFLFRRDIN